MGEWLEEQEEWGGGNIVAAILESSNSLVTWESQFNHVAFTDTMWVDKNAVWNGVINILSEESIPQPSFIATILY